MPQRLVRIVLLASAMIAAALATPALGAATFTILNLDSPGEGFNDPTPAVPVGGNPGTTIGQQRLNCFQRAAELWGSALDSAVPITVQASFNPLSCTAVSAVLGSAGPITASANFPGAEFLDHWYHVALANKRAGTDLSAGTADINAQFNSNLGTPGCLTGSGWYYGFDHNEGGLIDLLAVVLHEFAHGLGFSTTTNGSTGSYLASRPALWDRFLYDETMLLHWDQMTAAQRVASAINTNKLTWDGGQVSLAAPLFLSKAPELLVPFAPFRFDGGAAAFGAPLTTGGVTGEAIVVDDGVAAASTSDACETPFVNAGLVAGRIAVIDRGTCTFVLKAKNAQLQGAIGVILVNNTTGPLLPGGVDPSVTLPVLGITQADGAALKAAISGGPTTVTLRLSPTRYAGMSPSGRVRLYAPDPFQPGSSVSHFDVSLAPNALMEPAINSDLSDDLDLTIGSFKDIGWIPRDVPVATDVALVAATVVAGHPRLTWYSADGANESMRLYRRDVTADWARLATVTADGTGKITYEDRDAVRGHGYEYELGIATSTGERRLGRARVDVPLVTPLAIRRHFDAAAGREVTFEVGLSDGAPAVLEVFDAGGRRSARQELGSPGEGEHRVTLERSPSPGIYWVRLSQSRLTAATRFVMLR